VHFQSEKQKSCVYFATRAMLSFHLNCSRFVHL